MQDETPTLPSNNRHDGSRLDGPGAPTPPKMQTSKHREVLLIAALAGVLLIAGGLYGYRQKQEDSASRVNTSASEGQDQVSDADAADVDEATLAEDPDAAVSSDGSSTRSSTGGSGSGSGSSSGNSASTSQPRSTDFVKGGDGIYEGLLTVSSNLSAPETGTCTFSFSLNGTLRVERTAKITNSKVCKIEIPVSDFPKSAIYNFELTFVSTDGLAKADLAYDIEVE